MDAIIGAIGVLLRLPVYIIGFVILLVFWGALSILAFVWWLLFVPVVWLLLGIPLAFFGTAFGNGSAAELKRRLGKSVDGWRRSRDRYISNVGESFGGLGKWLIKAHR